MMDLITLRGISATGYHGVLPEERRDGQLFVVDVELGTDISAAAATDDLQETIDYAQVAAAAVAIIEGDAVDLIETLAERLATKCLTFTGVMWVRVTVHKPEAPVGVPFGDVTVTIEREQ